jgi:hypothetical protein
MVAFAVMDLMYVLLVNHSEERLKKLACELYSIFN